MYSNLCFLFVGASYMPYTYATLPQTPALPGTAAAAASAFPGIPYQAAAAAQAQTLQEARLQ